MVGEGAAVHVVDSLDARRVLEQVAAQSPDAILVQLEAPPGPADRFCAELSGHAPGLRIVGIAPAPGSEMEMESDAPRWHATLREPLAMDALARSLRPSPEATGPLAGPRRHAILVALPGLSNDSLRGFLEAHRGDLKRVVVHLRNTDLERARAVAGALSEEARRIGAADLAHRARRLEGSLQVESGLGEEFSLAERAFQDLAAAIDELEGGHVEPAPPPPPYPGTTSPVQPELIDRIKALLRAGDAEILDLLESEEAGLLVHLGSSRLRALVASVRAFDFDGALALLRQSFPDEVAS
jgi:HPt (histidine-containing phosphotransfer) domain-containing protein